MRVLALQAMGNWGPDRNGLRKVHFLCAAQAILVPSPHPLAECPLKGI